jgi:endonuclease-3
MAKMLMEKFGGKVPAEPDLLQQLPGVGRKTANVIASVVFKKPVMAVDTHVFRVAKRIGLADNAKTPLAVEIRLSENIPVDLIRHAHHWLILHGRYVCKARKPECIKCGLSEFCKYYLKTLKTKSSI